MQFTTGLIVLFAASLASALPTIESPDVGGQVITLEQHDSHAMDTVTVGDFGTDLHAPRNLFARAAVPNCKGSSYCSNSQSFKNSCQTAAQSLQPTTYTAGGDASGVCSGGCGLFVQGSKAANGGKCTATGSDLFNASQQLLANGCETCGSVAAPAGGDCIITVNYVSGCSA